MPGRFCCVLSVLILFALGACRADDFPDEGSEIPLPEATPSGVPPESSLRTSEQETPGTGVSTPGTGVSPGGSTTLPSGSQSPTPSGASSTSESTPAPSSLVVTGIDGQCMSLFGGERVTVSGLAFDAPIEVRVDGVLSPDVEIESETLLTFEVPVLGGERRRVDVALLREDGAGRTLEAHGLARVPLDFVRVFEVAPSGFRGAGTWLEGAGEAEGSLLLSAAGGIHLWQGVDLEEGRMVSKEVLDDACEDPWALASADVNGDGNVDVLVGCGAELQLLTRGAGGELELAGGTDFSGLGLPGVISQIEVYDIAGSERPGIVFFAQSGAVLYATQWQEAGDFAPADLVVLPDDINVFAMGDLNGNGHADLVTGHFDDDSVRVSVGRADGTFEVAQRVDLPGVQQLVVSAEEASAKAWLAVASNDPDVSASLWAWDAEDVLVRSSRVTGGGLTTMQIADFSGDGVLEAVAGSGTGVRAFHIVDGEPECEDATGVQGEIAEMEVGYLSGSGFPDLFGWNRDHTRIHVLVLDR